MDALARKLLEGIFNRQKYTGERVIRGIDWKWDDQDGGAGHVGTVEFSTLEGWVSVLWDNGFKNTYRVGAEGCFDLLVVDNAPAGVQHSVINCDECEESELKGIRWQCTECYDYDLCTSCYMRGAHDTTHRFCRIDKPSSDGDVVGPREGELPLELMGMFEGAIVQRGQDWNGDDEDGGEGNTGTIHVVSDGEGDWRSWRIVQWSGGHELFQYRVGADGFVDLKCTTPTKGGRYFHQHLPILGLGDYRIAPEEEIDHQSKRGLRVVASPDFDHGDKDGGEGHAGTVEHFFDDKKVQVCWDHGKAYQYCIGHNGKYELLVFDNATTGVKHSAECDVCHECPLLGMRWKCSECFNYDLCSSCYMGNKHDLSHRFYRIDEPISPRVLLDARKRSRTIELKGIFPGAKVKRGKDWKNGNQDDGGNGNEGVVVSFSKMTKHIPRSVLKVRWDVNHEEHFHRLGERGYVDLKYATASSGGHIYASHLPLLGYQYQDTSEEAEAKARVQPVAKGDIESKVAKAVAKLEIKPAVQPVAKTQIKLEVQPVVKTQIKPEVQPVAKTQIKPEVQPVAKTQIKPEVQYVAKTQIKPEVQPVATSKTKPEVLYVAKTDIKPGVEPVAQHDHQMQRHTWFIPDLKGTEAVRNLNARGIEDGSFLVRNSESNPGSLVLSVRDGIRVLNYHIQREDSGFYINEEIKFSTLEHLIEHYQKSREDREASNDGRVTQLRQPIQMALDNVIYDHVDKNVNIWQTDRSLFERRKKIGDGSFGEVFSAMWNQDQPVAIKVMKIGSMDTKDFMNEADTMKMFVHPNIVRLLAVCAECEPIYIIMEYLSGGSLLHFLKAREEQGEKSLKFPDLCRLGSDIAKGMKYLESKLYVHRDLAARNVLVSDTGVAKISDFGMARLLKSADSAHETQNRDMFPVRWTAPEVLEHNQFSIKSDVWSFGIVLVEIITVGKRPYPDLSNAQVIQQVLQGHRMSRPEKCPVELYAVMQKCWQKNPKERPTFESLVTSIEQLAPPASIEQLAPQASTGQLATQERLPNRNLKLTGTLPRTSSRIRSIVDLMYGPNTVEYEADA